MRSRTTLAGSALLATAVLAATVGLSSGDALAAHHAAHDRARPTAAADATSLTPDVTVIGTKKSLATSTTTITPGNTIFDVHSLGTIELVSFNSGYTLNDLFKDGKKLFAGDVKVVRTVDKKVNLWGGIEGYGQFAIPNLPAGSYNLVNLSKGLATPLTVTGTAASRQYPTTTGTIKMVQDMTYRADATLPANGWINVNNKASEPHFVAMVAVKNGTSRDTISQFLMDGAQGQPKWATGKFYDSGVVSPDHAFAWNLDASPGEIAILCFWPSKKTGVPHSLMGMLDVAQLK